MQNINNMNKNFFLRGERVFFRPIQTEDVLLIYQWFNDPITTYFMFTGQKPETLDQIKKLVEDRVQSEHNTIFIVVNKNTNEAIGLVGLYEINYTARKAEMRIIIGNENFRGRGYGTEITELITYYGFDRLNLNRIYLGVTDENIGGINAYKRAGYVYEGTLKQDVYRNSQYYDGIRMAILREDYYKNLYSKHKEKFSVK